MIRGNSGIPKGLLKLSFFILFFFTKTLCERMYLCNNRITSFIVRGQNCINLVCAYDRVQCLYNLDIVSHTISSQEVLPGTGIFFNSLQSIVKTVQVPIGPHPISIINDSEYINFDSGTKVPLDHTDRFLLFNRIEPHPDKFVTLIGEQVFNTPPPLHYVIQIEKEKAHLIEAKKGFQYVYIDWHYELNRSQFIVILEGGRMIDQSNNVMIPKHYTVRTSLSPVQHWALIVLGGICGLLLIGKLWSDYSHQKKVNKRITELLSPLRDATLTLEPLIPTLGDAPIEGVSAEKEAVE